MPHNTDPNNQPEFVKYALCYSKAGDAVFLSHLDTLRVLERAIRRSGLDVCYTKGCNPHIRLSTYRALPLGLSTDGEWFTVKIQKNLSSEKVKTAINGKLPAGFFIVSAVQGSPPVGPDRDYRLLGRVRNREGEILPAVSKMMEREIFEVTGICKGKPYRIDLRSCFGEYEIQEDSILFIINKLGDVKPRLGDLVKALYTQISQSGLAVQEIKVVYMDPPVDEGTEE